MKARWTKWGPIVYSAITGGRRRGGSRDRNARHLGRAPVHGDTYQGVRASLLPVLDDESPGKGPDLPARIVVSMGADAFFSTASCRGIDGGDRLGIKSGASFRNDAEAIAWLIAGER